MKLKRIACITLFAAGILSLASCTQQKETTVTETEKETEITSLPVTSEKEPSEESSTSSEETVKDEFTVTYMDELGNTLGSETVKKGETATFTGFKFATNNGASYSAQFKEWDKPKDTLITEDTTFTASYYLLPYNASVSSGVVKYHGSLKEITLPEKWDGSYVTTLGSFNYSMNSKTAKNTITTIHLPDTLKAVDGSCFTNCEKLSVLDGGHLETIGGSAFFGCTSLRGIDLSSLTSLGSYAFYNCTALSITSLPGIDIPENAFYNCTRITALTINEGTASIGEDAFMSCGITTLHLPESLESISDYAFEGCKLSVVYLGKNIKSIGSGNFDSVTKIYYSGTPEEFSSITLGSANRMFTTDRTWFYSASAPTDTTYHYYHYDATGTVTDWE